MSKKRAEHHHLRPIRLLSTDLDGTLLDFQKGVPVDMVFFERLAKYRDLFNLVWVVNTGRWWDSLALEMVERGFPLTPDWVILTEREIYKVHRNRPIGDYTWNHECAAVHAQLFEEAKPVWAQLRDFVGSQTGAELQSDKWSPVTIRARNEREASRIHNFIDTELIEWPKLNMVRNGVYFRFCHADFHKGSCLRYLQNLLGIPAAETLAAGDHHNDLPMLDRAYAHYLVCPSNAIDLVKNQVAAQDGYIAATPYATGVVEGWDALGQREHGKLKGISTRGKSEPDPSDLF